MPHTRLSQIPTRWTIVRCAHEGGGAEVRAAQRELLELYGPAARRYLLAALRDADAADDLYQDFALKFLEGGLRGADSQRGRFRAYLKSILYRMVASHFRRPKAAFAEDACEAADVDAPQPQDVVFDGSCRQALLRRAWERLEQLERDLGKPWHTVLRLRADAPDCSAAELAAMVGERQGREITANHLRVMLHRARQVFAELLLQEVAASLDRPDKDSLEQELADLRLLGYCRTALGQAA